MKSVWRTTATAVFFLRLTATFQLFMLRLAHDQTPVSPDISPFNPPTGAGSTGGSDVQPHLAGATDSPGSPTNATQRGGGGAADVTIGAGGAPRGRRRKAHWCYWRPHNKRPIEMLKSPEFGFETVNAHDGDDWDLIYGGYPHCGKKRFLRDFDWNMKTGLNAVLRNRGWSNLKPWQVWFPCMGCKDSYCNKIDLCPLLRAAVPGSCYVLPDHREQLISEMDGSKLWVLKRDGKEEHVHMGKGVYFVKSADELPPAEQKQDDGMSYIVQRYFDPFLGSGKFMRKGEVRIYLTVTSTMPLRFYAYKRAWAILANKKYNSSTAVTDKCVHDTHRHGSGCNSDLKTRERELSFEDFSSRIGLDVARRELYMSKAHELLLSIVSAAQPIIQAHEVNKGITESGAMCFSYMRADLGISSKGDPILYEINELPFTGETGAAGNIQKDSLRDLFYMVGLDQPPVPREERANYELEHCGGWKLLTPPSVVLQL